MPSSLLATSSPSPPPCRVRASIFLETSLKGSTLLIISHAFGPKNPKKNVKKKGERKWSVVGCDVVRFWRPNALISNWKFGPLYKSRSSILNIHNKPTIWEQHHQKTYHSKLINNSLPTYTRQEQISWRTSRHDLTLTKGLLHQSRMTKKDLKMSNTSNDPPPVVTLATETIELMAKEYLEPPDIYSLRATCCEMEMKTSDAFGHTSETISSNFSLPQSPETWGGGPAQFSQEARPLSNHSMW